MYYIVYKFSEMEVHHAHGHKHNKNLKEYFLEFIMLFLAVSLGFLAENLREQFIEKERSHELLQSFMNDVRTNIKLIDSLVEGNKNMIIKNDSAVLYLMTNDRIEVDSFFNFLALVNYRYLYNNETYEQMKSSGSLRYIKDSVLLKKMIEYSNLSKTTEYRSVNVEAEYLAHEYTETMQKWLPEDISIKRQTGLFLNRPEYTSMLDQGDELKLMVDLNNFAMKKKGVVTGNTLKMMRRDLVTVITRKLTLVSGSNAYMIRTKKLANNLIAYYNNHSE
jgi:hypothetical protein